MGGVAPGKVYHGADGAGFGFHDNTDAGADFVIGLNLGAEGFVGNVLEVYVEGGTDVIAVLHLHLRGVQVAHPAFVVRDAAPLIALAAVELAVKAGFQANAVLLLHITDYAAGQGVVGVDAFLVLFHNKAAGVGSFLEQGEGFHLVQGAQVHVFLDAQVLGPACTAVQDGFGVGLGALVPELVAQVYGEVAGLVLPGALQAVLPGLGIFGLAHRAVHVNIVQRGRYGQRTSVACQDFAAHGIIHVLLHGRAEQIDDPLVHGIGSLDVPDAHQDSQSQEEEQQGQEEHHHVDSVAVFYGVLYFALFAAHFFFITVAGSCGRVRFTPSSFSLVSAADALCSFTSAASFSA